MRETHLTRRGFTLIELMIAVAIIGLLAALSVANFMGFQKRAKRAEVGANLQALYKAEAGFYAEKSTYSDNMQRVGFAPERGNRYAYKLTATCQRAVRRSTANEDAEPDYNCVETDTLKFTSDLGSVPVPSCALEPAVVTGAAGSWRACAAANIDHDAELDSWSISSLDRSAGQVSSAAACRSGNTPAGLACNDFSDI